MQDWINILGILGLGAVLTELARGVLSWFMHKRQWSDEIKKTVIFRTANTYNKICIGNAEDSKN